MSRELKHLAGLKIIDDFIKLESKNLRTANTRKNFYFGLIHAASKLDSIGAYELSDFLLSYSNEKNIKIAQIKDLIQNPLRIQQSLQNLNLIDRRVDQIINFLYNAKTPNTQDVAYLRSIFPKNPTAAQQRMNQLNRSLRALQKTQALGVSGEAVAAEEAAKTLGTTGEKAEGLTGATKATGTASEAAGAAKATGISQLELTLRNLKEPVKDFKKIKDLLDIYPGSEQKIMGALAKSGKVDPQLLTQAEIYIGQLGKASGGIGDAAGAVQKATEVGKNVVIKSSELEAKTVEMQNIAKSLQNILKTELNVPKPVINALTSILEFFERLLPQAVKTFLSTNSSTINTTMGYGWLIFELYNTVINFRNAIEIYQKSFELPTGEKELKNDFDLQARGQLATAITSFAGVLGNPKSPISIKGNVLQPVLIAANLIGQFAGGTETSASFADLDMASTSFVGYENAVQAVNRNPNLKSIWPTIKSLVENNLTGNFGTLLQSTLANYNQISDAEKSILTSAALGYRQELRKQKGLTNTPTQSTQSAQPAQPAQIPNQATPNSYFALAKITNPQSYTGTAEQNEALRAAITKKHHDLGKLPKNQIYKDFYEAYVKAFGKWDQQPSERARNLNFDVNKQVNQPQNKIFKNAPSREIVQQ